MEHFYWQPLSVLCMEQLSGRFDRVIKQLSHFQCETIRATASFQWWVAYYIIAYDRHRLIFSTHAGMWRNWHQKSSCYCLRMIKSSRYPTFHPSLGWILGSHATQSSPPSALAVRSKAAVLGSGLLPPLCIPTPGMLVSPHWGPPQCPSWHKGGDRVHC